MYFAILIVLVLISALYLFFSLYRENKDLKNIIERKEKNIENLKKDIEVKLKKAQDIHKRMLPDGLSEPENFIISDYYKPAEYIGGDYYNLFKIDHESMSPFFDQYLFYFFDVSGHGIDSTLLSIFINDSIENYFKLRHNPGEMVSSKDLMAYIDQRYQDEKFPDDYLLCMFIGVLDLDKKQLEYSARGFQFPFYKLDHQRNIQKYNIGGLPISTAIGKMDNFNTGKEVDLKKGSTLFFSTDGLLESENENKIYHEKIDDLLKKYSFLPAPFFNDIVQKDFYNFMGNKDNRDDITYLIMDYLDGNVEEWDFSIEDNLKGVLEKLENRISNKNNPQPYLKNLKRMLKSFLKNEENISKKNKLNFKFVDNNFEYMLSVEDKSKKVNWNDFLKSYDFEKDIMILEDLCYQNISRNFFEQDKIFVSKNKLGNKIYFLKFKN
ncbi:MAG: PP2C family protein-serine/threonine phosphatase [Bacillota bacterium]